MGVPDWVHVPSEVVFLYKFQRDSVVLFDNQEGDDVLASRDLEVVLQVLRMHRRVGPREHAARSRYQQVDNLLTPTDCRVVDRVKTVKYLLVNVRVTRLLVVLQLQVALYEI